MFCKWCGKKLTEYSPQCPYCKGVQDTLENGNGFWNLSTLKQDTKPEEISVRRETNNDSLYNKCAPSAKSKKSSRKLLTVNIIITLIVFIFAIISLLILLNLKSEIGSLREKFEKISCYSESTIYEEEYATEKDKTSNITLHTEDEIETENIITAEQPQTETTLEVIIPSENQTVAIVTEESIDLTSSFVPDITVTSEDVTETEENSSAEIDDLILPEDDLQYETDNDLNITESILNKTLALSGVDIEDKCKNGYWEFQQEDGTWERILETEGKKEIVKEDNKKYRFVYFVTDYIDQKDVVNKNIDYGIKISQIPDGDNLVCAIEDANGYICNWQTSNDNVNWNKVEGKTFIYNKDNNEVFQLKVCKYFCCEYDSQT